MVSADNFGLGQIAAKGSLRLHSARRDRRDPRLWGRLLRDQRARDRVRALDGRREGGTCTLYARKFADLDGVDGAVAGILDSTPRLHGLFAVWDEPAIRALTTLRTKGLEVPITTIDLGNDAAIEMAKGGLIKGIGAQRPYDQGSAIAEATIMSLTGLRPPSWSCPARIVSDGAKRHRGLPGHLACARTARTQTSEPSALTAGIPRQQCC